MSLLRRKKVSPQEEEEERAKSLSPLLWIQSLRKKYRDVFLKESLIIEPVLLVAFTGRHISSSYTFASVEMRVVCDSRELISSGLVFDQMGSGIFQTSLVEHQHQGSCLTF